MGSDLDIRLPLGEGGRLGSQEEKASAQLTCLMCVIVSGAAN